MEARRLKALQQEWTDELLGRYFLLTPPDMQQVLLGRRQVRRQAHAGAAAGVPVAAGFAAAGSSSSEKSRSRSRSTADAAGSTAGSATCGLACGVLAMGSDTAAEEPDAEAG